MIGIDISEYQSSIDWNLIKSSVDYIIARDGYGFHTEDKLFKNHIDNAKKAGIPIVGIYHFSYAISPSDAIIEADFAMKKFNEAGLDKNSAIIFFDFEDDSIRYARDKGVSIGANEVIDITKAFCDTLKKNGYRYGVYYNNNFYRNYYNGGKGIPEGAVKWYADYRSNPTKSIINSSDLFQYSSTGKIDGIKGNVDLNDGDFTKFTSKSEAKPVDEEPKDYNAIAKDVVAGKYGNGDERKKKLGTDYEPVQKIVNEMVKEKKPVTDEVVANVIAGKYGNGDERKTKLEADGYIYRDVQDAVNKALESKNKTVSPAKSFDNSITGKYIVTASALNLRYIPGLMSENNVEKILHKDEVVQCWGYFTQIGNEKWYLVQLPTMTGYVSSKFIKKL